MQWPNGGISIQKSVTLTTLALAMLFISATAPVLASFPTEMNEPVDENVGWWSEWTRDLDRNGIDDVLDNRLLPLDNFGVFLDFAQKTTDADVLRLESSDFTVKYQYKYLDTLFIEDVKYDDLSFLASLPGVVMVEADLGTKVTMDSAKPTVGYDEAIDDYGYLGDGITIAIIDTGIYGNHAGLDDMDDNPDTDDPKIVAFYDVVDNPDVTNGTTTPIDKDGHGTHCAGIAAGTGAPDKKYVGIAPEAKLVGVRMMDVDGGSQADGVTGLEWVIENKNKYDISIASMSFGPRFEIPGVANDGNSAISRLADTAVDEGLIVMASAGNDGPTPRSITPPGDAKKAITVGNVYDNHNIHPSSSRGPVGSFRDSYIKPDVAAPGDDIYSAETGTEDGYISGGGTSMSTPFVAGVAALILQASPSLSPTRVKEILTETADGNTMRSFQSSPNNDYGWGVINIPDALEEAGGEIDESTYVKITSPAEGTTVSGNITIRGTVTVNNGDIASIQIRIGSGSFQDVEGTYGWAHPWDTSTSQNGETVIFVKAVSDSGGFGTDEIVVTVDNPEINPTPEPTPPDEEPTPPADGNGTEPPEETDDPNENDNTTDPSNDEQFLPIPGFEPLVLFLAVAMSALILRRRKKDC